MAGFFAGRADEHSGRACRGYVSAETHRITGDPPVGYFMAVFKLVKRI